MAFPPRRKLHKRLHTQRTFDAEQIDLNEKAPISGGFADPPDGLEPSTPSLAFLRQPVATDGNGFGLFRPFPGLSDLRRVATGCDHGAP